MSVATLWEVAVKVALGKLELVQDFQIFLARLDTLSVEFLPISADHVRDSPPCLLSTPIRSTAF